MYRKLLSLMLLVPVTGLTGCTVCQNVHRTVFEEPSRFNWKHDRVRSRQLYLQWADQAWRSGASAEAACNSPTYLTGFREGFAEFVYAGGNGEPPAVPPREFWNADLRNERGQTLADLWFAGYRHGARVARDGGYRDMVVVRSSLFTGAGGDTMVEAYPAPLEYYGPATDHHPTEVELLPPETYLEEELMEEEVSPLVPPVPRDPMWDSAEPHNPFLDDPVAEPLPDMSVSEPEQIIQKVEHRQETAGGNWQALGTRQRAAKSVSVPVEPAMEEGSPFSEGRPANPFLR